MIGDTCRYSWSSLHPVSCVVWQMQYLSQALVWFTEIVYRSHQVCRLLEGCQLTRQRPTTPYQCYYARSKRAIQSLYVCHMWLHSILRLFQQQLDLLGSTLNDTTDDPYNTFLGHLFDHLDNTDMLPISKMRTAPLACEDRCAKYLLYRRYIRGKAIHAEQQSTIQSTTTHLLYQMAYQASIPMCAYNTTQPKASGYLKRHSQPSYTTLMLDSYLISLYLTQVPWLLHQMLVNFLAMIATTALPGSYRPFIQTKGSYYGWDRTTVCQERYHLSHEFHRIPKTIEHSAFAFCKRLAASVTYVSFLFAAVNANVTTTRFPSCRTVWIVAEYLTGIHDLTPFSFFVSKRMSMDPLFCQPLTSTF
jgi:hypothetical protein